MADSTIANLTDGTTAEDTDRLPVERSPFGVGQNRYITPAYIRTNIHGTYGTGVATALGVNVGSAGAFVTFNGALGTPSSGTLTNATGLPAGTGLTGQVPLANGGTGANLPDPGADRIMFWDDSAGAVTWLTAGSGLSISGTTINASGGASTPTFPGGIPLTGVNFPRASGHNVAIGTTDIYTVPTGKRALISKAYYYNNSAGSITVYIALKNSGNYYRLLANTTLTTNTSNNTASIGYIAEAGESISVVTTTTDGLNVRFQVVEFDDSVRVSSKKLLTLASGDNTIYTVPANTAAYLISDSLMLDDQRVGIQYVNDSGGTRALNFYIVSSGASVGTEYKVIQQFNVSTGTRTGPNCASTMSAGDYVVVNTNAATATQLAWVNVMEVAA